MFPSHSRALPLPASQLGCRKPDGAAKRDATSKNMEHLSSHPCHLKKSVRLFVIDLEGIPSRHLQRWPLVRRFVAHPEFTERKGQPPTPRSMNPDSYRAQPPQSQIPFYTCNFSEPCESINWSSFLFVRRPTPSSLGRSCQPC